MGKAQLIYEKARKEVIDHIRYENSLIHHAVVTEDEGEEGGEYSTESDWAQNPLIKVEVTYPYTHCDDVATEDRVVTEVHNEDDGSVTIYTDIDGEEISSNDIDIISLIDIAEVLEESYKILCSNK